MRTRLGGLSRSTLEFAAGGVALQLFGLLSGPLLAHALNPEGRGQLASQLAPFVTVAFVSSYALTQRSGHLMARGQWALQLSLRSLTVVTPVAGVLVVGLFWSESPWLSVLALVAVVGHNLTALAQGAYLGSGRARKFNLVLLAPYATNLAVLLVLFALDSLTARLALVSQLGTFVAVGALSVYLLISGRAESTFSIPEPHPARVPHVSVLAAAALSPVAFAGLDQTILSRVVDNDELGLFAVAYSYSALLETVVAAISFGAFRLISSGSTTRPHLGDAQRKTMLVSMLGALTLAGAAPLVIPVMFGESFAGSVVLAWILLAGRVFHDLYAVVSVTLTGDGLGARAASIGALSILLIFGGILIGDAHAGLTGAVIGVACAEFFRWLFSALVVRRGTVLGPPRSEVAP